MSGLEIVVGCPVRERAWVIDRWFAHVLEACEHADATPTFVFVVDPADETHAAISERWCDGHDVRLVLVDEAPIEPNERGEVVIRSWLTRSRLDHMVEVRNLLLAEVRRIRPQFFWSVDSDILVAPWALASAVEFITNFNAVGSLTWMHHVGTHFPNFGFWDPANGGFRRMPADRGGRYATEVIMALKLMDPAAYGVDYEYHHDGEDLGWSLACRRRGLALGIDGAEPSKHVMAPDMLDAVDPRLGW